MPGRWGGGLVEYQLVRMNGDVLVSFQAVSWRPLTWEPPPGGDIWGACAGRWRVLPDGGWMIAAYYPDGFPGRTAPWPFAAELPG